MMDKTAQSNFFYTLRGIAILSVAYAHSLALAHPLLQRAGAVLGLLGVPLFLFCSGYYFRRQTYGGLLSKLGVTVAAPWLIWGTAAFCISLCLGAVTLAPDDYLLFIIGHGTWLYYIPAYLVIRLIFNRFNSSAFLYCAICLSVVFNVISYFPPAFYQPVGRLVTPWQNPLNWLGFYAFGILAKRNLYIYSILALNWAKKCVAVLLPLGLCVLLVAGDGKINYWNPYAIVLEYLSLPALIIACRSLSGAGFLKVWGQNSYLLYLLHMQAGIAAANIVYRIIHVPQAIVLVTKPAVVIVITMILIYLIKKALAVCRLSKYCKWLGIHAAAGQ